MVMARVTDRHREKKTSGNAWWGIMLNESKSNFFFFLLLFGFGHQSPTLTPKPASQPTRNLPPIWPQRPPTPISINIPISSRRGAEYI